MEAEVLDGYWLPPKVAPHSSDYQGYYAMSFPHGVYRADKMAQICGELDIKIPQIEDMWKWRNIDEKYNPRMQVIFFFWRPP